MEWLCRSKQSRFRLLVYILFALNPYTHAVSFELLSEGAMDSVSAVSAESAEDIINIAGSPAAGLTIDGYEQLPFQTRVSVGVGDIDKVSEDLDFELVKEVEDWADGLRERLGSGFEIGYVDELPQPVLEYETGSNILFEDYNDGQIVSEDEEDSDRTRYEISRIEQTFELIDSGVDTITYRFDRFIERAATIDADPFDEGRTIGSGYISDLRSSGENTLTSVRDKDKPLF